MLRLFCIIILLFLAHTGNGQIIRDTLVPAEVKGLRDKAGIKDSFSPGVKTQAIAAATMRVYKLDNLAELLAANTTAFIKSYGLNTFSTLSLRGASAAQSAVYWEGVPLMNGATGLTDLSGLPMSLIQNVSLNYGSSAALYGSGNVGGAVMLQDVTPAFSGGRLTTDGKLGGSIGSFEHYGGMGQVRLSSRQLFVNIGFYASAARNDFQAEDERGKRFTVDNAKQFSYNAALTLGWKIDDRNLITAHYWRHYYDREIPRALFEARSSKEQTDDGHRLLVHWKHTGLSSRTYAKAALLTNQFEYADTSIGINSSLRTQQLFAEAGWEKKVFKRSNLLLFVPVQYFRLDGSADNPYQYRLAVAGAFTHKLLTSKLPIALNLRVESFNSKVIALPGINAAYALSDQTRLRVNAQYTYRAPTLNELYYSPGGNADLKPERGWSFDGGVDWKKNTSGGTSLQHSTSVYSRNIQDWIIWLGGSIWTPHNLAAVHSRGIEIENSVKGRVGKVEWQAGLNGAYTRATTTESYLTGDKSIGRQIPYVPLTMLTGVAGLGWEDIYVQWNTVITGKRFTTTDESQEVPSYTISNLRVSYRLNLKRSSLDLQLSGNNLLNASYVVVGYRPMPGINYQISVVCNIKGKG